MNFRIILLLYYFTEILMLDAASLRKDNFETTNTWNAMSGYFTTDGGTVVAIPSYTGAGTIDVYGSGTESSGLQLSVNSSAATGNWTAGLDSGILNLYSANTRGVEFLTLAFSLSASTSNPVRVRVESYSAGSIRTGSLATLIFPAAPDFYQRFAIDLNKMSPHGAGTFNPADPKVRIFFELDSTANGTGWPTGTAHLLKIDNVNYSSPKYYVKPATLGGNNSNNGLTETTAFATIQRAADLLGTNTTDNIVSIMEGADYIGTNTNGNTVTVSKPGLPDAWIVFKNYPGQKPVVSMVGWQAFQLANTATTSAAFIEIRGLVIRGQSFIDSNGDRQINPLYQPNVGLSTGSSNGNGISIEGRNNAALRPRHFRFADNLIELCPGGGIGGLYADRIAVENNIVRNNCWWMIFAGSGISFLEAHDTEVGANNRMLIRGNVVYGNECMLPWYNNGTNFSDGNGIIIDSYNGGYTGRTVVSDNLVFNNGGSGIHVLKAENVDIVHNTAFSNSASPNLAYGEIFTQSFDAVDGKWVKNVRVTNNIMVAQKNTTGVSSFLYNESATSIANFDPTTIFHNRNTYARGDVNPPLSGANFSNNTDLGRNYNAFSLFISPSIDPAVADFRLRSASPARNYGFVANYRSVIDLVGTARGLAGSTDSGVYQTVLGITYSPMFSPVAGAYTVTQNVTLASDTVGSTIIYTTNGSIPAVDSSGNPTNGIVYTGSIAIATTTTLKAIAWKSGLANSPVSTAIYNFQDLSGVPVTFSLDKTTAIYPSTQVAQGLTRTPGAYVRYTTNGTDPTLTTGIPQEYRGLSIIDYASVRYRAFKTGRAVSAVSAANITIRASTGNTVDGPVLNTIGANKIHFVRFDNTHTFSAAYLFARISGVIGSYRAAIYSDSSGTPSARLAVSSLVVNPVTGWTSFPLSARAVLTKNTSYWLAIWSDNASAAIYADSTGGTIKEITNSSPWPNPVGTTTSVVGTLNYSIYASNSPPNLAPVVGAGTDQNIPSGGSASLSGSVTDDGVPIAPGTVTQLWSKFSGPGSVNFSDPSSIATMASFTTEGTYVLRLTARDSLLTAFDEMTVTVANGATSLDPSPPPGVVRARFTDGSGTTWPQQYPGVTGDGWAGAWVASSLVSVVASGNSPLQPNTANHMSTVRAAGPAGSLEGVYRQWSNTTRPTTAFSRLTFDFRLDSSAGVFNTAADSITLTARPFGGATSAGDSTFFIRTFGGTTGSLQAREWGIFNGDGVSSAYNAARFVPSGLICVPGVTYTFTIDLFGASAAGNSGGKTHGTYDVSITDGTSTVTVLGSRFRSAAYASGGYLSFSAAQDTATDNLGFSVDTIEMTSLIPTTSQLVSNINPTDEGELVTFTATVSGVGGIPDGNVIFTDGTTILATVALNASGEAILVTSALAAGSRSITATYSGATTFIASASSALALTVKHSTAVILGVDKNPANLSQAVTFTAMVDSTSGGIPAGIVTFRDGPILMGTATLDGSGIASLTVSNLIAGPHPVTATYEGNSTLAASVSFQIIMNIETPTLYQLWLAMKFTLEDLENMDVSGPLADPDADGYENLLEYAFETEPKISTLEGMPSCTRDIQGRLVFGFLRARNDLIYTVQGSDELVGWTAIETNPGAVGQNVTVTDTAPVNAPSRFLRLHVTLP